MTPTRPQLPLLDDGYLVEPEPPERVPYQGWALDAYPRMIVSHIVRPHRLVWFGLGVCVGVLLVVGVVLLIRAAA